MADDPHDPVAYRAGAVSIDALLAQLPAPGEVRRVSEQLAQVDSKDMDFDTWRRLALRCGEWLAAPEVAGVVVTHGTDTLEETAFFLHSVLAPDKPVLLTCAMRPTTALSPDGPQNLADALTVAAAPGASGVVAVCAGVVHPATDVAKTPQRLDAFSPGDAGPVGHVEDGRLRLHRPWPRGSAEWGRHAARIERPPAEWPRVQIVMNHAGADGSIVEALVAHGVDGIVVAGTGNGTVSEPLAAALRQAQARGVAVARSTRCPAGVVQPHAKQPFPDKGGLSPVKARIAMLLELLG